VTIDKGAGTFTLRSPWPRGDYVRPLGELKYATAETEHGAYRLVFVMERGHRKSMGSYSDQSGQPEAADAVNRFLGLESSPTAQLTLGGSVSRKGIRRRPFMNGSAAFYFLRFPD
jgi:hypothetical protein